jgi:hypothetical protein
MATSLPRVRRSSGMALQQQGQNGHTSRRPAGRSHSLSNSSWPLSSRQKGWPHRTTPSSSPSWLVRAAGRLHTYNNNNNGVLRMTTSSGGQLHS